jgi:hypothetical protein
MAPDTDEYIFDGEIIAPDFLQHMRITDLHQAFVKLAELYGRERAVQLWGEIPEEHDDD